MTNRADLATIVGRVDLLLGRAVALTASRWDIPAELIGRAMQLSLAASDDLPPAERVHLSADELRMGSAADYLEAALEALDEIPADERAHHFDLGELRTAVLDARCALEVIERQTV